MSQKSSSKLPEGASVLELEPYELSVPLAIEVAELGASDAAVRALGGDEALDAVREKRQARSAKANGDDPHRNGAHPKPSDAQPVAAKEDAAA
jgi:hypothetical protein